ncbi:hypothetical protein ABIF42_006336 [Bradyrhizobium diazoefficiens]
MRVVLADPALEREGFRRRRAAVGRILVERHVVADLAHQRVQEPERVALGLAAQLARDCGHGRIDGGEVGGAQEHAGRKALVGAAQHAAGVVGFDQALGRDLDIADGPAGQNMGDVAEGVLMGVELGVGRDVDLPFRHILPVMAARRHAQDLDHAGRRRLVAIGRGVLDSQAHGGPLFWRQSGAVHSTELWCAIAHLRISRFRVWSFGPSRNDGVYQIKYCFVMISPSLELSAMNS